MGSALVPIWIFGGTAVALIILNIVTAGGTSVGERIDPLRMNPGIGNRPLPGTTADPRLPPAGAVDPRPTGASADLRAEPRSSVRSTRP